MTSATVALQLRDDLLRDARICERRCADGDERCTGLEVLPSIVRRADTADPDDGHSSRSLNDFARREHSNRQERRTAYPAKAIAEPRLASSIGQLSGNRVDDRDS